MESVKIPFSGINRSIDEGISADGQSMELINARIKNGSVEPIGNPVHVFTFDFPVEKIYYHSLVNKIIVFANSGDIYALDNDYTNKTLLSSELQGSSHVEFLGNMACFFKGNNLLYALHTISGYEYIGNIPELPQLKINQQVKIASICPSHKFLGGRKSEALSEEEFMRSARYVSTGYYDNCIDTLNKEKYITQPCLIKYAFRTTSGKYIKESPVIIVEHNQAINHMFTFAGLTSAEKGAMAPFYQLYPFGMGQDDFSNATFKEYHYDFAVMGTKLGISLPQDINLSRLKSVITSIDIFISPIECHTKKEKKYNSIIYTEYETSDYKSQLLKAYKFYKVAEFSLDGEKVWELENWSKDSLAIQEQLVTTETRHQFSAKTSYVYNSRLHLADISYTLFDGYGYGYDSFTQEEGDNELYTAIIFTHINTEQGEHVRRKRVEIKGRLAPFLTYPDSRATKMEVYVTKNYTGNPDHLFYKRTFPLTKHPHLNLAYYYHEVKNAKYEIRPYYIPSIYESGDAVLLPLSLSDEVKPYVSENTLKVSDLNNPISFPAVQTYQPSTKKIIGLCSNTTALSQGQFGQHPLYVFAEDGVYAMSVGTEGVVYSTQTPVTRDVCVNSKSIKGIDQAVIFASQRGIMMIAGNTTKLLSGDLDGYIPSCVASSPIIQKIANIGNFELSSVVFNHYIKSAEVGYNYRENEIIVANPEYKYSYVYNIGTGTWAKISHKIISFTNKHPECYALINREGEPSIYDIQNDHRSVSKILLLSKPIKMGSNAHKRILQTALRGVVKRSLSDLYLRGEPVMFRGEEVNIFSDVGLYVLGSNDAEHFSLISGKESIVDIRDLVTKMNKSKPYKYFMVALVGGVRTDVSLNYMELIVSEAFDNRLR